MTKTTEQKTEKNTSRVNLGKIALEGILNSALVIQEYNSSGRIEIIECAQALSEKLIEAKNNDLTSLENTLVSQATALDSVFANMMLHAKKQNDIKAIEKLMRLGLKAQSQCRQTIETLAEIKNPQPYIQHNRAQYQQVNNAPVTHARKEKPQNELLDHTAPLNAEEFIHGEQERMDARTPKEAVRSDKDMETLE